MCNHYRKGQPVAEFSQVRLPGLAIPEPFLEAALAEHTFPKYPAPIVIQQDGNRGLVTARWGVPIVVPGGKWKPVTNARNDKLLGRTWKKATEHRRCLIPATGYFEPGGGPVGAKGEILFTVIDRPCFFFAGLWEPASPGTEGQRSFTIVTTAPNDFVARFHDRMPIVLDDQDVETWLGDTPLPLLELERLCLGLPSHALFHEELAPRPKPTKTAAPLPHPPPAPDQLGLF